VEVILAGTGASRLRVEQGRRKQKARNEERAAAGCRYGKAGGVFVWRVRGKGQVPD